MDYDLLLTAAADLGYGLLESGAEIYRVEESIQRFLLAYGVSEADPFVIPNCIIVSFVTAEGKPMTQVRRMPSHGTDVDLLERYNDLCRHLCRETPPLPQVQEALAELHRTRRYYPLSATLAAYFIATTAFSLFFGGTLRDALCGGVCGLSVGLALHAMTQLHANLFFKSMLGSALAAFLALALTALGLGEHPQIITIASFMALVPGIVFTNAIRDVMAGDMVAGISKIADALLTGVAVALGAGCALTLARLIWGVV